MEAIRTLIDQGQLEAAESALRERLVEQPEDADALNLYAVVLARRGDLLGARSHFKRAVDHGPDQPMYLVNYALVLSQQGDVQRAAELLERAAALDPNWARSHTLLAQLSVGQGQLDAAETRFKTALRANEHDPQALVGLAQVAYARGDLESALRHAQQAIAVAPRDARAQAAIGMVLMAQGHHSFARKALENAIALEANNPAVLQLLARAQLADRDRGAAMATVDRLAALKPQDAPTQRSLAELALAVGRFAEARQGFERLRKRVPDDGRVLLGLAQSIELGGDQEAALALLAELCAGGAVAELWQYRLNILQRLRREDDILAVAREFALAHPTLAAAHAEHALAAEHLKLYDEARQATERALALEPGNVKAIVLGAAYELYDGRAGASVQALEGLPAESLDPNLRPTRAFLLGYAADRRQDGESAVTAWMALHSMFPPMRMPALLDPLGAPRELPMPLPVEGTPRPLVFVPMVPGAGGENLVRLIGRDPRLLPLLDRLTPQARRDGLAIDQRALLEQGLSENQLRVFRRRYWRAFERLRAPSGRQAVDVLPSLEWPQYAALSAALPHARVLVVLRDPRDALVNWLAYGGMPVRPIPHLELAANYLARQYQHLDRMRSSAGLAVHVLRAEDIEAGVPAARATLAHALNLAEDSLELGIAPRTALAGLPDRLEAERWRQYTSALGKSFRLLQPAIKAFGYD